MKTTATPTTSRLIKLDPSDKCIGEEVSKEKNN